MCGITGYLHKESVATDMLTAMAQSLRHRGPDHTGFMRERGLGLAMTRLSIIDIAGGKQPMHSADGNISLIFNGEIYNFKSLRTELESHISFQTHSDTEVILHGYAVWGKEIFARLNGMFAVAFWDRRRQTLSLVRDPLGVKPLYHLADANALYFSSEIKTFTQLGLANHINPSALSQFLCSDYVFHPDTAIDGIKQVMPGTILEIDRELKMKEWSFRVPGRKKTSNEAALHSMSEMRARLDGAIIGQTVADVPYGLLLSSGLDSMTVLSALHRHALTDSLCTYTAYYPDSPSYSEDVPVRKLAKSWGFQNTLIPIQAKDVSQHWERLCHTFDNLEMLPTAVAIYFACQAAGQERRVLLSGNGGDELFFGYPTYRATRWVERLRGLSGLVKLVKPVARMIPPSDEYLTVSEKIRRFLDGYDANPDLAHVQWRHIFRFEETHSLLTQDYRIGDPGTLYANQLQQIADGRNNGHGDGAEYAWGDMRTWMVDSGLMMWDKAGMSASVEIRVPLIDPDLVDYFLDLPFAIRTGGKIGSKGLQRRIIADDVPEDILGLPKHGFQVPISTWLHGELHSMFRDLTASLPSEVFNHGAIDTLWREFDERKADNTLKLWTLGALAGWAKAHHIKWRPAPNAAVVPLN